MDLEFGAKYVYWLGERKYFPFGKKINYFHSMLIIRPTIDLNLIVK